MITHDLLVGGVACCLGLALVFAAIFNWNWWYELTKTRWLAARFGRGSVRLILAGLGAALVALGIAIGMGFRWAIF